VSAAAATDRRSRAIITADDLSWAPREARALRSDDVLVDVILDARAYRAVAHAAIHALHDFHVTHTRLCQQHARLRDEFRALRAHARRRERA
jgi:hypothetical protein